MLAPLFDPGPIVWVQQLLGLGWPLPWRILSLLGTNWGILLAVGLALWLWDRRLAYGLLAVVAVEGVTRMLLNQWVHVPRPSAPAIVKYEHVEVGSFPSGHVATAAALWTYLSLSGKVPWLLTGVVVILVATARIYLGVHYLPDVVVGAFLAGLVVWGTARVWPPVREWLGRRPSALYFSAAALALLGVLAGAFFYFGDNPYKWRAGGMVAGVAIALPLEYRYVRYRSGTAPLGRQVAKALIGFSGIAAMAAVDQVSGEASHILGLVTTLLAGIWALLITPTIFAKAGWAAREEARRDQAVDRTGRAIAIACSGLAALLIYGTVIEPRLMLDTEEHVAVIPGLPPAWEGARVAALADFQAGMWLGNTGTMRTAVADILEKRPAAVLLAGDFIYEPGREYHGEVRQIMDVLRPLGRSGIPTFAVLGNHDWGLKRPGAVAEANRQAAGALRDSLRAAGIRVLHNQATAVRLEEGGPPLYVVGIGSHYAGEDRPREALEAVPRGSPRVVFMHHPDSFAEIPAGAAPLAVAGHTHGGQIRLPFTPAWSWLTFASEDRVHADGWVDREFGRPGNRLYVTRGIGMSLIPMRVNCPPEVTYITLRAQHAAGWFPVEKRSGSYAFSPASAGLGEAESSVPDRSAGMTSHARAQ